MRCSVLWVFITYFSSDKALLNEEPNDLPVPDFSDYEDGPENNFSALFTSKIEENEDGIEPLTPIAHDLEKLQETTIMYVPYITEINKEFRLVSVTKDILKNSDVLLPKEETNNVLYTEIVQTKYINEKTQDSVFITTQDLISTTQTLLAEVTVDNFRAVAKYKNKYLQPTFTGKVLNNTIFNMIFTEEGIPVHTKALIWKRAPTKKVLDIPALVTMVNMVASDYQNKFNLSKQFHAALLKYDIPTCEPLPTTVITTTTPPSTINFNDAHLIAKCFVCGLKEEGIPRSSACADAFSGDFIPLVKVDTKARGQIANFRKYCRYLDVSNFMESPEEPQSLFGRFTGGCSVRWADLTGVYTQRTCRNRRRAVTGKHFASKRMAKLELMLSDLENGCVISPMATLTPVSRAISLFSRFHACVCTGSWCNGATIPQYSVTTHFLLFLVNVNR